MISHTNLKTLKRSFKEATYINYVSREEKTLYKRIWATDYKIVSYAALASIFLTLSLVIFSFDVSRAVVDGYGTASNFITAIKFDFFDIIFDFIRAVIIRLPNIFFPVFIWGISVVALIVKCICSSMAKKQIEHSKEKSLENA